MILIWLLFLAAKKYPKGKYFEWIYQQKTIQPVDRYVGICWFQVQAWLSCWLLTTNFRVPIGFAVYITHTWKHNQHHNIMIQEPLKTHTHCCPSVVRDFKLEDDKEGNVAQSLAVSSATGTLWILKWLQQNASDDTKVKVMIRFWSECLTNFLSHKIWVVSVFASV